MVEQQLEIVRRVLEHVFDATQELVAFDTAD
jgi:hypothetical protein